MHALNLRLKSHDFSFARVRVHLKVREGLTRFRNVFLESLKLLHEHLNLIAELCHIRLSLVKLGFLLLGLLNNRANAFFKLTLKLLLDLAHLRLVSPHLFLVMLFMLAISLDLLLDFLSDVLVAFDFLRTCISQVVNFSGNLGHALLEVLGQIRSLLSLLIKHRLVLQVQVMILFEDGRAEEF